MKGVGNGCFYNRKTIKNQIEQRKEYRKILLIVGCYSKVLVIFKSLLEGF